MTAALLPVDRPWTGAARSPLAPFLLVGAVTSAAWYVLYALLEPALGAQAANAVALLVTADANTLLNSRGFGRGRGVPTRAERLRGLTAFSASLLVTSAALAVLDLVGVPPGGLHTAVLVAAEAAGGAAHYVLLRRWAFAG